MKELYMRRCIELARLAGGYASTNPMVGAVVVCNGKIIGEGYHMKCGGPHAEVNAINSVKDPALLPQSEIYVSLEPCAHFGKTPPCADLIISKGIKKVYVGCLDPFAKVDGKGIQKLRAAGIPVEVGILEKECQELNKRFFTSVNMRRPYIILKWAQSADGYIDKDFRPVRISNKLTATLNHKWRSEEDAILVGTATAERDNPSLTNRLGAGKNPVRVVVDRLLRLPKTLNIFNDEARTIVITEREVPEQCSNVSYMTMSFSDSEFVPSMLGRLFELGIHSLIVEGGAKTHKLFLESGLVDEIRIFQSPEMLGNGTKAASFSGCLTERIALADNQLLVYKLAE